MGTKKNLLGKKTLHTGVRVGTKVDETQTRRADESPNINKVQTGTSAHSPASLRDTAGSNIKLHNRGPNQGFIDLGRDRVHTCKLKL